MGDKWHWTIDLLVDDDADPVPTVEGEARVAVFGSSAFFGSKSSRIRMAHKIAQGIRTVV